MAINTLLTDKRIQKQALAQGLLKPEELQAHLESLPDRSSYILQGVDDEEDAGSAEKPND